MLAILLRARLNELHAEYRSTMARHRSAIAKVHTLPGDVHTNPAVYPAVGQYEKEMSGCRSVYKVCREIESLESIMDFLWGLPSSDCHRPDSSAPSGALIADDVTSTTAGGHGLRLSA